MGINNLDALKPDDCDASCGYTWWASYIQPDSHRTRREKICILSKNHDGDHRSLAKVISSNTKQIV